jgi:putative Holliday junction resolvase
VIPAKGRLLGIDYGTVRVGLAICDAERRISSPLDTYRRRNTVLDAEHFQKLVAEEEIVGLVVGLAISLNDTEGPKAKECRDYAAWLSGVTNLPIAFQDERFTTHYANDVLANLNLNPRERKERRDAVAAQVILQVWLEADALDRPRPGE